MALFFLFFTRLVPNGAAHFCAASSSPLFALQLRPKVSTNLLKRQEGRKLRSPPPHFGFLCQTQTNVSLMRKCGEFGRFRPPQKSPTARFDVTNFLSNTNFCPNGCRTKLNRDRLDGGREFEREPATLPSLCLRFAFAINVMPNSCR